MPARLGAGPTRFTAYAAAARARPRGRRRSQGRRREPRGPEIVSAAARRRFLSPLPVELLRRRLERGSRLPETLARLGIRTLGELAGLPRDAVADRFGAEGLRAWTLANGGDERLRPRAPREGLRESLELPEAASGPQLERALALLVDRLLANPARRGRTLRRLRIAARLAGGGSWRVELPLREASASPERLMLRAGAEARGASGARAAARADGALARPRRRTARSRWSATSASAGAPTSPRRSARRGRRAGATRSCACSRSIRTRGSPSGASR